MFQTIFTNTFLNNFTASGATQQIGTLAGASLRIVNMSNRGLSVYQNEVKTDYLTAYEAVTLPNTRDLKLTLDSAPMMGYLHPNAEVDVISIPQVLPYSRDQLLALSANAPNSAQSVLSMQLKVDPASGFIPAGNGQKTFANNIAYFEFFNLDTQGRTVYLNFNQAATGGSGDFRLLPDPNKQGQGAVYQVPADYNGFYYSGGDFQVMAWYQSS